MMSQLSISIYSVFEVNLKYLKKSKTYNQSVKPLSQPRIEATAY